MGRILIAVLFAFLAVGCSEDNWATSSPSPTTVRGIEKVYKDSTFRTFTFIVNQEGGKIGQLSLHTEGLRYKITKDLPVEESAYVTFTCSGPSGTHGYTCKPIPVGFREWRLPVYEMDIHLAKDQTLEITGGR